MDEKDLTASPLKPKRKELSSAQFKARMRELVTQPAPVPKPRKCRSNPIQPKQARISREQVEYELSKPRCESGLIRFNLSGLIRCWEVHVGRSMGVTVASHRWSPDALELILDLAPSHPGEMK